MVRRKNSSPRRGKQKSGEKLEIQISQRRFTLTKKTWKHIQKLQNSTSLLIPKLPFARIVKEVMQDITGQREWRVQSAALSALQEAAECYLVHYFEDSNLAAMHGRRITLMNKDMKFIQQVRQEFT